MRRARLLLLAGALAGTLDICYAIIFSALKSGVAPIRILQSVASGLLGQPAYTGGVPTAILGLALHFLIAFIWASLYFAASTKIAVLTRRPVLSGMSYGAFVYAAMNLVVVPLSRFPRKMSFPPLVLVTGLLVHMCLIGLPIALAARRAGTSEEPGKRDG